MADNVIKFPSKDMNLVEACGYLGIAPSTMYGKIDSGEAPRRYKRGGRWYFKKADLDAYLKATTRVFDAFCK
jgi:excisionase family DNA binding protein